MMSSAPTTLKANTNNQKSGRILKVRECQHGQHSGDEVTIGGELREARWQIGTDDARKDEDEPEEAEAVQRSDGALRVDPVHRLEPGQDVHADAKQPRDIA